MAATYSYYALNLERNSTYRLIKLCLSPLLGALTVLAYAPFNWWPIAFACLVLQLFFFLTSTAKQAFFEGWLYGIGYFGLGASWVFISIYRFGGGGIVLSSILTLLLILSMALYYAFAAYIMRRWLHRNHIISCLCSFPAMWVLAEWARGHWFTGFPWLILGYSQTTGPLHAYASIFGVYGISLLICLTAGALTSFLFKLTKRARIWAGAVLAVIWLTALIMGHVSWTHTDGAPIQVSIVQGNIAQQDKWNPDLANSIMQTYIKMTEQHWHSQLIVWPEAAVPVFPQQAESLLLKHKQQAIDNNTSILYGIPLYDHLTSRYYNGAIIMGKHSGLYMKRHLVPFGEYFPMKKVFSWVYNKLSIPLSDLSPGPDKQKPLQVNGVLIAPFICYEIAFPAEVAQHINDANIITVLTDDSWFGDSLASPQHLQMAQMRALENGRFVIFASNKGPSAIINAHGNIEAISPKDQRTVLTGSVTPMAGDTPYLIETNHLLGVLLTLLLVINILTETPKSNLSKFHRVEFTFKPKNWLNVLKRLKKYIYRF